MTAVQRLIRTRTQRAWAQLAVLTVTAAAVIAAWIDSRPTRIVSVALIALVLVTVAKFCLVTLHAVDFQTTRLSTLEERCARTESTMDSATRA
ncbi:MAG: hypothetical protein RLZZ01_1774, partial [Actinomycetota bacterium]